MSNIYVIPYYPVGSILEFDREMDMQFIYGGTWESFGQGRMTVGIDTSDTSFSSGLKEGGSKTHIQTEAELSRHAHRFYTDIGGIKSNLFMGSYIHKITDTPTKSPGIGPSGTANKFVYGERINSVSVDAKGSCDPMDIMNPYIVVYRYRKVAD